MSCPVCGFADGFHDKDKHAGHEVPRELLKDKDWQKKKDEDEERKEGR